jgi:drug/metabolite transporter (DMT)-like permease
MEPECTGIDFQPRIAAGSGQKRPALNPESRNAAIAAFIIMLAFGLGAFYLPTIMLALGDVSTTVAGIFAVVFVAAFFGVFWLRGRFRDKRRK